MGMFRHPKTGQEKRQNQNCEYCRPARRPHNLIDVWDDDIRQADRCWKRYRKTQYKTKSIFKKKKDSSSFIKSIKKKDHWYLHHKLCYFRWGRCAYCKKHNI